MRGPGETEIETDRVLYVIESLLKDKIKAIDKQMGTQRGNRGQWCAWFCWYTNVGKSTLMNAIGKSDVLSKTSFSPLWIPQFEK
jgi:GTP-binding protein HflX